MKKLCFTVVCLLSGMTLLAYEAILFGDVHFDSEEVRDPAMARLAYQKKEKDRNLKLWEKSIPALLDRARRKVTPKTAFVLQLGDIIQGDCGSRERHEKSLNTVLPIFCRTFPSVPFLVVTGNHDTRGKGGRDAYEAVMIPYLARTLEKPLAPTLPLQYAFMQENDLYVCWDGNRPDLDFLEQVLQEHPKRRRLFVVTHLPVIPLSQNTPAWVVYGIPDKPALRRRLLDVLAKNNAIVLCAHVHTTALVHWQSSAGKITQISFSSMFPLKTGEVKVIERDVQNLFPEVMQNKDASKQMAVLADLLPGYRKFKVFQPKAGFTVLKSSEQGVTLEFYCTEKPDVTHTIQLP